MGYWLGSLVKMEHSRHRFRWWESLIHNCKFKTTIITHIGRRISGSISWLSCGRIGCGLCLCCSRVCIQFLSNGLHNQMGKSVIVQTYLRGRICCRRPVCWLKGEVGCRRSIRGLCVIVWGIDNEYKICWVTLYITKQTKDIPQQWARSWAWQSLLVWAVWMI